MIATDLSRTVELGLFVLRRVDHCFGSWTPCPSGLRGELRELLERRAIDLDAIVDPPAMVRTTEELVEHVIALVEAGRIEVGWRSYGHCAMNSAPVQPQTIAANDGVHQAPAESPVEEPPEYAPETEVTLAQAETLRAAARLGTPFCEVCEMASAKSAAQREAEEQAAEEAAREAAQVAVLTRAAANGTAFCEICTTG